MVRIIILFFCFLISNSTFSQSDDLNVYPIRVDHKWGYAKFYGNFIDTLIPPRYDYIGDVYLPWNIATDQLELSPYRLFEIDNKVGLLNNFLQETIPNKYNRIRPISQNYHAVEFDQGFQLINEKEEICLNGMVYDDIKGESSEDDLAFFFVKKNRKWAVKNKKGDLILDHQYAEIKTAGISGLFKVKKQLNGTYWTLIDTTGTSILPEGYEEVEVIHPQVICVKKDLASKWQYFISKASDGNFTKQPGTFSKIKKLTDQMFALLPYHNTGAKEMILRSLEGDFEVINTLKVKLVGVGESEQLIPDFYPIDKTYAIQSFLPKGEKSVKYKLVDSKGKIHSQYFDTLRLSNKDQVYFAGIDREFGSVRVRKWGVLQPVKNKIASIDPKYSEIYDFEDDIAITQLGNQYGAIAITNQQKDELPCLFETVYKSGEKTIQIQTTGEKAVIYKLNSEGKFTEDLLVNNTIVFSKNKQRNIKEAPYNPLRYFKKYKIEDKLTWGNLNFRHEEGKLVILDDEQIIKRTNIEEEVISIEEISADLLVIHLKGKSIKNKATLNFSTEPISRLVFFSISKNKIVNEVPMIGFRSFEKSNPYTAFLDETGKMGLINQAGKQLMRNGTPIRYLYIGTFHAGRARVCVGEQLFADIKDEVEIPPKYSIGSVEEFKKEFHMVVDGKISFGKYNKAALYALGEKVNSKWGFINEKGELVLDASFDFVGDFSAETERATVFETLSDKTGIKPKSRVNLIDQSGKKLLNFKQALLSIDYKNINKNKSFFQVTVGKTPTFYFNKKGHQVFVNPTRMRPFVEGLALFRSKENKWGFVDSTGNVLINPRYKYARPFSDGLAMVVDSTGFCSFINTKGATVFKTNFTEQQQLGLGDFHENRCWFKGDKGWTWGCFDRTGEKIIEPNFYHKITKASLSKPAEPYSLPMDFNQGVASVSVLDENKKLAFTIIDSLGTQIIKPGTFAKIEPFDKNGLATFSNHKSETKGLLNSEGKEICPPKYKTILPFKNGFAKVGSSQGNWGLINIAGEEVAKPSYEKIGLYAEGLVAVKVKNRGWSFINEAENLAIRGPFRTVTAFQGGISFVHQKDKDFLIDKNGNEIFFSNGKPLFFSEGILGILKNENVPKRSRKYFFADDSGNNILGRYFKEIFPFTLGVAKVRILAEEVPGEKKKKQLLGAINKRGVMIVPPKYRNLHQQPDGNIIINPQRFFGLVSLSGKTLLEPIYDSIFYYPQDKIFRAEQGEKIGYFELDKDVVKWIWEMRY